MVNVLFVVQKVVIKRGRSRRTDPESDHNNEAGKERTREQDQWEKEELEERLHEKDASSTKKLGEFKLSKKQEEETRRRREAQDRMELIPSLRYDVTFL